MNEATPHSFLHPQGWKKPSGYAHGMTASGRLVFLGGQIGWDESGKFPHGLVDQCRKVLENILTLLKEAGAGPQHLVRLTWYVVDIDDYLSSLVQLGEVYRSILGRNFPAMAMVQVVRLVEAEALLEIEATAVISK